MAAKQLHERIRRGCLMVVKTCKGCGGAYQLNVTVSEPDECPDCSFARAGQAPSVDHHQEKKT